MITASFRPPVRTSRGLTADRDHETSRRRSINRGPGGQAGVVPVDTSGNRADLDFPYVAATSVCSDQSRFVAIMPGFLGHADCLRTAW